MVASREKVVARGDLTARTDAVVMVLVVTAVVYSCGEDGYVVSSRSVGLDTFTT